MLKGLAVRGSPTQHKCVTEALQIANSARPWRPAVATLGEVVKPAPNGGRAPGDWATCDRMTEVAAALKAMLQKSPLPSREIHKWAAASRMGRTLLFEAEAKAKMRARHDGKEQQWSWEVACVCESS